MQGKWPDIFISQASGRKRGPQLVLRIFPLHTSGACEVPGARGPPKCPPRDQEKKGILAAKSPKENFEPGKKWPKSITLSPLQQRAEIRQGRR
jgi:hypothetical protein